MKPSLSETKLYDRARILVREQGYFLLLFDVVNSKQYADEQGHKKLLDDLNRFCRIINRRFERSIIIHEIGIGRLLSNFELILGDGGGAYFSTARVIEQILRIAQALPFKLRWTIAKDGWDKANTRILK